MVTTCPKCGHELYNGKPCPEGKACENRTRVSHENADRQARGLSPVDSRLRSVLSDGQIPLETGRIHLPAYARFKTQLFAPTWAVLVVEAVRRMGLWGIPENDQRPMWQLTRLLQLAALRWCQTDQVNRDAIEALGLGAISWGIDGRTLVAVWHVLKDHVKFPDEEYKFNRRGQRTYAALRAKGVEPKAPPGRRRPKAAHQKSLGY